MIEKLPRFILQRFISDQDGTIGATFYDTKPLDIQAPICYTLEPPSRDNQKDDPNTKENESGCIPAGDYFCKWTLSTRLKKETFELFEVPGRSGIRIHAANVVSELKGCIAAASFIPFPPPKGGVRHTDGKLYKYYGCLSGKALAKLESILPKTGCVLSIKDAPTSCTPDNQWMLHLLSQSKQNYSIQPQKAIL